MSKRILITGATGFVGSHILEALMQDGSLNIFVACRNKENLIQDLKGEIREGDLRDNNYVKEVVKDIDVICHAGAWTSLWNHKKQSNDNYLEPTLNLIKASKVSGVKQFIFPSTTSATSFDSSADPLNKGIPRSFWPHLCNVITIENELRKSATPDFSAIVLRLGIFTGKRYGLGVLPILLPRLKTHLVPWVAGGKTNIPLTDGEDIGRAFLQSIKAKDLNTYEAFNIVGTEQPSVREMITFIHDKFNYPKPHFSVPFGIAYPFAWLMEKMDPIVPWEPLITRSIIHLIEKTNVNNDKALNKLNYKPQVNWKDSVLKQIEEIHKHQKQAMSMAVKE
jgi:nucleoside-diphosphate-sugar epimerase